MRMVIRIQVNGEKVKDVEEVIFIKNCRYREAREW
jgi:hypothetical protein